MQNFKKFFSIFSFAFTLLLISDYASATTTMSGALCKGYSVFNGPVGQAMAIFAIVALGVGLFLGKITWGLVFAVALGIGAIFGAPKIVQIITQGEPLCQTDVTTSANI